MDERYRFTPRQRFWTMAGFVVCFLIVGGSAFASSYTHIRDIALIKHQSDFVANMMPWSVDGMLGIAAIAMYIDSRTGRHPRGWARFAFWFGLIASMAANVGSFVAVWGVDWGGMIVASAPPALFMVSVEIVSKPGKLRQAVDKVEHLVGMMRAAAAGGHVPGPGGQPAAPVEPAQPAPTPNHTPVREVVPVSSPVGVVRRGRPEDDEPLPAQLVALARQVGTQYRQENGREITRDALRADLRRAGWERGISNVTAGRLLDLLRTDAQPDPEPPADAAAAANGAMRG